MLEFIPYFQPIISLQEDRLEGFEVLARWDHHTRGLLGPAEFISAAEAMNQIDDIFWKILGQACEIARSWPEPISIAVNMSSVQFADQQLGEKILAFLREKDFAPNRLVVEITESELISDIEAARNIISFLKDNEVRLSMDDFGTGFSSLQYMQQLPFDTVKIDRSFVGSFTHSHDNLMIVSSIVALCRSLGMKTTAEGVENETDLDFLKTLGCTFAQGFLYSKPVCAADATGLVEHWSEGVFLDGEITDIPSPNATKIAARA